MVPDVYGSRVMDNFHLTLLLEGRVLDLSPESDTVNGLKTDVFHSV